MIDTSIPGWCNLPKLQKIARLASVLDRSVTPNRIPKMLEIGSWAGRSLFAWAANAPRSVITSVDNLTGYNLTELLEQTPDTLTHMDGDPSIWGFWTNEIQTVRQAVIQPLNDHRYYPVEMINMTSERFFSTIGKSRKYDLIYIDGDHEYDGVRLDLKNSLSRLETDGLICGDDYVHWEGVSEAVDEFCHKNDLFFLSYPEMDFWMIARTKRDIDFWDCYSEWNMV